MEAANTWRKEMDTNQMELVIKNIMGDYGVWIIATAAMFFFKNAIENFVSGLTFLWGSDYNVDDVVYIGDRKARIVRQTITKTVFYFDDSNRRLIVPNRRLNGMGIEFQIPVK